MSGGCHRRTSAKVQGWQQSSITVDVACHDQAFCHRPRPSRAHRTERAVVCPVTGRLPTLGHTPSQGFKARILHEVAARGGRGDGRTGNGGLDRSADDLVHRLNRGCGRPCLQPGRELSEERGTNAEWARGGRDVVEGELNPPADAFGSGHTILEISKCPWAVHLVQGSGAERVQRRNSLSPSTP
ncbi:hypothetical protein D9M72_530410 [compost metagenome]